MPKALLNSKGLTLVEGLISIMFLSVLMVSLLGAFFVSRLGTARAKHRIAAMNIIREYMEKEIKDGYLGGVVDGDYYVTASSASPVSVTIDDRNTVSTSDDLIGSLTPSPYPATQHSAGTVSYKMAGFIVSWNEDLTGNGPAITCSERAVTYVCDHS